MMPYCTYIHGLMTGISVWIWEIIGKLINICQNVENSIHIK